jgi:hypothetical protein
VSVYNVGTLWIRTIDPELHRAYYRQGMALSDEKSMLNGAHREGLEKGLWKGL